jgi:hypothetical protein
MSLEIFNLMEKRKKANVYSLLLVWLVIILFVSTLVLYSVLFKPGEEIINPFYLNSFMEEKNMVDFTYSQMLKSVGGDKDEFKKLVVDFEVDEDFLLFVFTRDKIGKGEFELTLMDGNYVLEVGGLDFVYSNYQDSKLNYLKYKGDYVLRVKNGLAR